MDSSAPRFGRDAFAVFLLLCFAYGYFGHEPEYNGNARIALVLAMVDEGRLTIDSYHDRRDLSLFTGDKSIYQGHYYSDKAPGSSFAGALAYLPVVAARRLFGWQPDVPTIKWWLTFLAIGLPSAWAGSLLYALARHVARDSFLALVATLSVTLGTIAWPFSAIYFGHQLAAALLFAAFYLAVGMRLEPERSGPGRAAAIGGLLGLALITEHTVAVIVGPLGLYALWAFGRIPVPGRRLACIASACVAGLLALGLLFAYNAACFGSPLASGYEYHYNRFFRESMSRGLMGIGWPRLDVLGYITIHPAIGLLWQSPALLLVPSGARRLWRDAGWRRETLLCVWAIGILLLINAGYYMWWGGSSPGARHLVPMLPFAGVLLAAAPRRWLGPLSLLAAVSVVQMLVLTSVHPLVSTRQLQPIPQRGLFDYSAVWSWGWSELREGRLAPNLGQAALGLEGWPSPLPLVVLLAAAAALGWKRRDTAPELPDAAPAGAEARLHGKPRRAGKGKKKRRS